MGLLSATNKQVPDNSVLDHFNKQTYIGNRYSVSSKFTVGTSETALVLMQNVQTGNQQTLKSLFQDLVRVVENTAADSIILNIYSNPTVSAAGTAATVTNLRPAYGVTGSVATVTTAPTVSANGVLIDTIAGGPFGMAQSEILKIIDNGQSLLITGIASAASTSSTVLLQWYEL